MEVIALGFALGAATVAIARRGRGSGRALLGWTARQVGWVSAGVAKGLETARGTIREEYHRGRELGARPTLGNGGNPMVIGPQDSANGASHESRRDGP